MTAKKLNSKYCFLVWNNTLMKRIFNLKEMIPFTT